MDRRPDTGELTFTDYLRPLWRFKYAVIAIVVVAALGTYAYYESKTKIYEASTDLYVGESDLQRVTGGGTLAQSDERTIANQARLVTTPRIARAVRERLDLSSSPEALLGAIRVLPNADSDFLTIVATGSDPKLTADLANGFATSYVSTRTRDVKRSARLALREAKRRLEQLGNRGAGVTRMALRERISTLQGAAISPPSSGQQLSRAEIPSEPTEPNPERNALFAAVLALMLGIVAAYLLDRNDSRVRRLEEVETLFDLPVLASIPRVRGAKPEDDALGSSPIALREPHRTLRVNLDLARADHDAKAIMVSSALPSEGKSTVVRNLAISYREAGARVAVLELDLRRPVLAGQLGLADAPGVSDGLAQGTEPSLQRVRGERPGHGCIDVAVAGAHRGNPTVLLSLERLSPLVARLREAYDVVLLDSSPLLAVSDSLPLLNLVDGVVLIVRAGTTTHPAAERVRRTLERVPTARILGAVANDVSDDLSSYYYAPVAGSNGAEEATASAEELVADLRDAAKHSRA